MKKEDILDVIEEREDRKMKRRNRFIALFLGVGLLIFIGWAINDGVNRVGEIKECLEPIARDFCEQKGMFFKSVLNSVSFFCIEDERTPLGDREEYLFLKEEIEICVGMSNG